MSKWPRVRSCARLPRRHPSRPSPQSAPLRRTAPRATSTSSTRRSRRALVLTGTRGREPARARLPAHRRLLRSSAAARRGCTACTSTRTPTGASWNVDPDRKRRSCCCTAARSTTSTPSCGRQGLAPRCRCKIYFDERNRVKLAIGLARGKKLYDKRADMARRDSDREIARALKERQPVGQKGTVPFGPIRRDSPLSIIGREGQWTPSALFKFSSGLYVVSADDGERAGACRVTPACRSRPSRCRSR